MKNKTNKDFVQHSDYAVNFGTYKRILSKVLSHDPEMFHLEKKTQIVDVGCGYGDLLKTLRSRGFKKIVGIEPDAVCRKVCLQEKLDVRNGTITKTRLPNGFADVVIVNEVFHHIDNFEGAMKEIARILKPNGFLCFLEPSPTILRKLMDILTFQTPLPHFVGPIKTRFEVMKLEMETGLYPHFLKNQKKFHTALNNHFSRGWLKQGWFFQFGKYKKRV